MQEVKVKIVNHSGNPLPQYGTTGAAAMDIRSNEDAFILQYETRVISTGLFVSIPEGYEIQIRPRSGLAAKHGITVLNTPGTIDSDYRGEIKVILYNTGPSYRIKMGDRIAQMKLDEVPLISWLSVEKLDSTERGEGGLGHTGSN
jgi:dUTP pyrophosphatase